MKKTIGFWLAATVAVSGLALPAHAAQQKSEQEKNEPAHQGQKVTMDQLPSPVASKLKDESKGGGKIEDLRKETIGGSTVYKAEVVKGNEGKDLEFDQQGKVLSSKKHSEKAERQQGQE